MSEKLSKAERKRRKKEMGIDLSAQLRKMARRFGMPPHLIDGLRNTNYANTLAVERRYREKYG